jgi:hypothetical protein
MGCFDIFCIICGNPPHSILIDEEYAIDKIKNNMAHYKKITNWMNKCTILTASGQIIKSCKEKSCNVEFVAKNKTRYYETHHSDPSGEQYKGFFLHDDCFDFVKKTIGLSLRYDMIATSPDYEISNKLEYINYGILVIYFIIILYF